MRLGASAIPVGIPSQRTTIHPSRTSPWPRHACLGRGSNPTWGPYVNCTRLCNTHTHTSESGPPTSPRRRRAPVGLFVGSGLCGLTTLSRSWEYRWSRHEPRGPNPAGEASECCLLGGQGAAMCAALTRSISRPPLAPGRPPELGGRGWVCWCEGRVRGEGVGIYAQSSRNEAVSCMLPRSSDRCGGESLVREKDDVSEI